MSSSHPSISPTTIVFTRGMCWAQQRWCLAHGEEELIKCLPRKKTALHTENFTTESVHNALNPKLNFKAAAINFWPLWGQTPQQDKTPQPCFQYLSLLEFIGLICQ